MLFHIWETTLHIFDNDKYTGPALLPGRPLQDISSLFPPLLTLRLLLCLSCERSIFGFLAGSSLIQEQLSSPLHWLAPVCICPPLLHSTIEGRSKNTNANIWMSKYQKKKIVLRFWYFWSDSCGNITLMICDSKITMCEIQDQANSDNYDNDD